jgi:hypothetical protein
MARPAGKAPKPEVIDREQAVVALRRQGLTWDAIAKQVGYKDPTGAHSAYMRASKRVVKEDIDAIRQVETERLDIAQSAIWQTVLTGDNQSIATLLRIMERRAKLLGLDQPVRIQAEVVTYDGNAVRAELERIILASRNDSSPTLPMGTDTSEAEPTTA